MTPLRPLQVHLPTSLQEALRLRLATVQARDEPLHLLLQVTCVMGGSCTKALLGPVWQLLYPDEEQPPGLDGTIARGMEQRLLKYMGASGMRHGDGRRRSSAASTPGSFVCHPGLNYFTCKNYIVEERHFLLHVRCVKDFDTSL